MPVSKMMLKRIAKRRHGFRRKLPVEVCAGSFPEVASGSLPGLGLFFIFSSFCTTHFRCRRCCCGNLSLLEILLQANKVSQTLSRSVNSINIDTQCDT